MNKYSGSRLHEEGEIKGQENGLGHAGGRATQEAKAESKT